MKWHFPPDDQWILYRYWPGRSWNYHVSVDCQELYFPKGLYFPKCAALRENMSEGKYNSLGTTDTWYFIVRLISVILDGQNEWFPQNFMCSTTTTKFGNKTRSLRTKQNWMQTWQLARVLLWRSIVNHCVLCVRSAFLFRPVS